jgi:hypothetical protein
MKLDEVKKYFNTGYNLNKLTGMSHVSMLNWQKLGYVPIVSQMKIQSITHGELKADLEHDRSNK